jgi:hypothetical protein
MILSWIKRWKLRRIIKQIKNHRKNSNAFSYEIKDKKKITHTYKELSKLSTPIKREKPSDSPTAVTNGLEEEEVDTNEHVCADLSLPLHTPKARVKKTYYRNREEREKAYRKWEKEVLEQKKKEKK